MRSLNNISKLRHVIREAVAGLNGDPVPGLDDKNLSDDDEAFDNMTSFIDDVVTWCRRQAAKSQDIAKNLTKSLTHAPTRSHDGVTSAAHDSTQRAKAYTTIANAIDDQMMFDDPDTMADWCRQQAIDYARGLPGTRGNRVPNIQVQAWNLVADKIQNLEF